MAAERFEVTRHIAAPASEIFSVLTDPVGHVRIDSTGMLMSAEGERVTGVGDRFVVHMDREALGDRPMGKYDVTVIITELEPDRAIEWTISGTIQPPINHLYGYTLQPDGDGTKVTSYYDWRRIDDRYRSLDMFPIIPEANIKATLGILARTVGG